MENLKQKGCSLFPRRPSLFHSGGLVPLCYLYLSGMSAAFIRFPELNRCAKQRGRNTQKFFFFFWKKKYKKMRRHRNTHTRTHTETHIQVRIYRHSIGPISQCCQQGDRGWRKQDEFSSASFHHTAMTPLFTSPIYLYTGCLPPCLVCARLFYCVCVCVCV